MQTNKEEILKYFDGLAFEASSHEYHHEGAKLNSVSSVIKKYTEPFDAYKIAFFVAKKRTKDTGVYTTREDILEEWDAKKNAACDRGNEAHAFGEDYPMSYFDKTNKTIPLPQSGFDEAIMNFWDNIPDHIEPCLYELRMFSKELGIAGTADLILFNKKTGKYILCDYKTNIDLYKNHKGKKLLAPFDDLLDMPYSKYELQLSIYQILFEQCGLEIESRRIIWIREDGTYTSHKTQDLTERLKEELSKE